MRALHLLPAPRTLDRAGVVLSSACAVHCAFMPAVAGLLPVIGLHEAIPEAFESLILVASAILAVVSFRGGCRHQHQWRPWLFFGAGLGFIAVGRLLLHNAVWLETPLVVVGALLITTAHLVNWRLCCAPVR